MDGVKDDSSTRDGFQPFHAPPGSADPQDAADWKRFCVVFRNREGFDPNPKDSRAQDLYHYFTAGAHEEFLGRLNPQNDKEEATRHE